MSFPLVQLPRDYEWRQSGVTDYLGCPYRFYLGQVLGETPDHVAAGYAAPIGSAVHYAAAWLLQERPWAWPAASGWARSREGDLKGVLADGLLEALAENSERGEHYSPDQADAALEKLHGEWLELLVRFSEDPRIQGIHWTYVEHRFEFQDNHGRRYRGTVDAAGVVEVPLPGFGFAGREAFGLYPGDVVLVDWKTGVELQLGWVARGLQIQLGFYEQAPGLDLRGARTMIGAFRDLAPPKRPRDPKGDPITEHLKDPTSPKQDALSQDYARGWIAGQHSGSLAEADAHPSGPEGFLRARPLIYKRASASKKRIAGAKKRSPRIPNPAYAEAVSRPRGPFFHECRVDLDAVNSTICDAIRGAEAGLFPRTGHLTGQCRSCPFAGRCVHQSQEADSQ